MSRRILLIALLIAVAAFASACGSGKPAAKAPGNSTAKITFVELGSTTCIPCKQMQPVMKSIEARYAGQVQVIFHDVMKDKAQAQKFGIKLIPTQVFLDAGGKEITRHEGFFPEAEIDKILKAQGLAPKS